MTDLIAELAEVVAWGESKRALTEAHEGNAADEHMRMFQIKSADFIRAHAAEIEAMARRNEALRLERNFEREKFGRAVKALSRIHAVIYPHIFDVNGKRYAFHSPLIHEQMQALSDRIRAIPDEIAAMRSAKEDGK